MEAEKIRSLIGKMSLEQKAQICSGRDFWKTQDIPELDIPSAMMCDGPNGLRKQLGKGDHLGINESIETVCYPTASAMASSFDRELIHDLGVNLGKECRSEDVAMLLGPGVNIKRSPLCGRNFEYFSEDPYVAGEMGAAYIKGVQSEGVASCVKHFAANNQETSRLSGSSQVDERTLHEIYLPAFENAVKNANVKSVMCAYNALNGIFCAENKELLTDILRSDWGFDGFVVTDWGAVKDRVKGLHAGVDLEMPGSTEGKTAKIIAAVENGELPQEVLDETVYRVLSFVMNWAEVSKKQISFDREKAHQDAEKYASECAVLLKNENELLPLSLNKKIAYIGDFASSPRYQGAGSSHINVKHAVSALEEVPAGSEIRYARGYDSSSETVDVVLEEEAVRTAEECDMAVLFLGLPESYETEGLDRENINIPENQNHLVDAVYEVQKNIAVVLYGGSVMELPWIDKVSSVLLMHLGGDRVGAATDSLLFGEKNPSGKLAETWPMQLQDNPSYLNFPGEEGIVEYHEGIFVGYRYYEKKNMAVRFPFGHGLSYTKFAYSNLTVSSDKITDHSTLTVSVDVENTGSCFGKEAVQLYIGADNSKIRRAVKELKGFEKVSLNPGEKKTVKFTLDSRAFSYYETKIHDWYMENGAYTVYVGSSSADVRLTAEITAETERELPIHYTRYSTFADLLKSEEGRNFFAEFTKMLGNRGNTDEKPEGETEEDKDDPMGAGARKAAEHMMMEMTLNGLYSYGMMTEEAVDQLVERLNNKN